jgi:uncharacterized protein
VTKTRVPAVDGLFVAEPEARLIGGRGRSQQSYFFPKDLAGGDPACRDDDGRDEVLLSRTGTVWSFTSGAYQPPPPYPQSDPYEPFVLAAVQLDDEQLVVLGQMVPSVTIDQMAVGMAVELVTDTLYEDDEHEYLVWKWAPRGDAA